MKLSVSLPDQDLAILDQYVRSHGTSRSGALHAAVQLLREQTLTDAYKEAFAEWDAGDDAAMWDATTNDGTPAAGA